MQLSTLINNESEQKLASTRHESSQVQLRKECVLEEDVELERDVTEVLA